MPHLGVNRVEGSGFSSGNTKRSPYAICEDMEAASSLAAEEGLGQTGLAFSEPTSVQGVFDVAGATVFANEEDFGQPGLAVSEPIIFQSFAEDAGGFSVFSGTTGVCDEARFRTRLPRPRVVPTDTLPLPADQEAEELPFAPRPSREPSPVEVPRGGGLCFCGVATGRIVGLGGHGVSICVISFSALTA